jgi:hypothetical protein
MNIHDIIRKNEAERTEEELGFCFKVWFHSRKSVCNHLSRNDIPNLNKILNNHQLVSKTRIFMTEYCPFQYLIRYLMGIPNEQSSAIMIGGKNLHWADDIFWKTVKIDVLKDSQLEKAIFKHYLKVVPAAETSGFILDMIKNFVLFETRRILDIYNQLGQSNDVIRRYIYPVSTELPIENWDRELMGIIDRIQRATNDALICMEYKYGRPKFFGTYREPDITQELAFYNLLIQGKDHVYAINDKSECIPIHEVLGIEKPKFYYGSMLFLQNIEQTGELFKIKNVHMNSMKNKITKYWNRIETGDFPPSPNDACYQWCEHYWGICEHNPEWLEIENAV